MVGTAAVVMAMMRMRDMRAVEAMSGMDVMRAMRIPSWKSSVICSYLLEVYRLPLLLQQGLGELATKRRGKWFERAKVRSRGFLRALV